MTSSIRVAVQSTLLCLFYFAVLRSNSFGVHAISNKTCDIEGFSLLYKNFGKYEPYLRLDTEDGHPGPFRSSPQEFGDGFVICYEPNPSNIQAVISSSPDCTVDYVDFLLTGTKRFRKNESTAPYMLFGNIGPKITGRVLGVGEYELSVTPNNDVLQRKTINFDVIECGQVKTWTPPNECNTCTAGETCLGSECVDTGYLSFHLTQTGLTDHDLEMIVKTPGGAAIKYDFYTRPSNDTSGVYLDGSGWGDCCTCSSRWAKSIVFPSKDTTPIGNYQVELYYVDPCSTERRRVEEGPDFELQVFVEGMPVSKYTTFEELGLESGKLSSTEKDSSMVMDFFLF